jgi:hypothetical protein
MQDADVSRPPGRTPTLRSPSSASAECPAELTGIPKATGEGDAATLHPVAAEQCSLGLQRAEGGRARRVIEWHDLTRPPGHSAGKAECRRVAGLDGPFADSTTARPVAYVRRV